MTNIFTSIIRILDTLPITGEENVKKMTVVFSLLHKMEAAAEAQDDEEGENG